MDDISWILFSMIVFIGIICPAIFGLVARKIDEFFKDF